ncbi:MAG: hypothetical protein IKV72_01565, partial [Firmicutes bacterium]|nr:hypothetical protein [Bacillota bacterium]
MECLYRNNQYVYILKDGDYSLFYNNTNGKAAYAKDIDILGPEFYELPDDTSIDLNEVSYEQLYLAVSESCNFRCKYCR